MRVNRRSHRLGVAALGATFIATAAITIAVVFPTVAKGAVVAVTSVTCSVTGSNWCVSGNDGSSGIGVIGTSKSGTGLRGTSTSQYGLKATSVSGTAILAQTTSGSSAITATGSSSSGKYGVSATGDIALYGQSNNGTAVMGVSPYGDGVEGGSTHAGSGVYGHSNTGIGGEFFSDSGYGVMALSHGGTTVLANNSNGNGADVQGSYIALIGRAPASGGYPLALNDTDDHGVFNVDGKGNVFYKGSLNHVSATAAGGTARSFGSNSTQPTIEDTGTAQLIRGSAVVRLDSAFAASIEPTVAYRVFVTPNGDTNGLFVIGKTAAGFVVRESHAGRSTVPFDYRIVATALGGAHERMAILSAAALRAFTPSVSPQDPLAVKMRARRLP